MVNKSQVLLDIANKKAIKVISGLTNLNYEHVLTIARASQRACVSYIDIAADPQLVKVVKANVNIPICVSGLEIQPIYNAVLAGADLIEVGNYESLYKRNTVLSVCKIITLVEEIKKLCPRVPLTVTIPYILNQKDQINLCKQLESLRVDYIQTEGNSISKCKNHCVQDLLRLSLQTLACTYELVKHTQLPIICSSGLSDVTVPLAFSLGASGIGIGKFVTSYYEEEKIVSILSKIKKIVSGTRSYQACE
uniref:Uncharacterized protein ycf23 n=1 Tax=Cyanidium caldarium TaxID=2771 RepID=YCF23_CYACA|nr:hypothetical protein JXY51_pgp145 [Cyanidium caldarium]O19904.1 RecName: Full=Uncharacterized protein ycf23 [Cyanidium caldarium]AAB82685.1 unknown [Cyanidium caldarium]WDB00203.1 hypothetical protein CDCA019_081 [Cyanidium caldarium]